MSKKYQVVTFIEMGFKTIVEVPENAFDPFEYAKELGNKVACERAFMLGWNNEGVIDSRRVSVTLVDPPYKNARKGFDWDYDRSRRFYEED